MFSDHVKLTFLSCPDRRMYSYKTEPLGGGINSQSFMVTSGKESSTVFASKS